MAVDDVILPLCDVKGCRQPQCGEALGIHFADYVIRVQPCRGHYRVLYDAGAEHA